MRRVVAVLGAVLMVAVALLVRGVIDGDDDGGGSDGSRDADGDGEVTLLCADELEDVCRSLRDAGTVDGFDAEPVGDTVDRMALPDAELGADAWLTLDGFPQMTDVGRGENGLGELFAEVTETERATGIVIATSPDRTDPWQEACGGDPDWECIGDVVGEDWADHGGQESWREIKIGFDAPGESATGLLVVAQAVGAHLDDPGYARNELESGDTSRWLRNLAQDLDGDESRTLARMITQRGSFSAVGTLAGAAELAATSSQGRGTGIFYPAPMYEAAVVLAAPGGSADGILDDEALDEALETHRWTQVAGDVPLPDAGTLYALREMVS